MPVKIKYASLYSGCGGLDLGFERAGFQQHCSFDHDVNALETLQRNTGATVRLADLSKPDADVIQKVSESDILIAGPPCQGFSTAGKNDPTDERNKHLLNVAEIACLAKPKLVLIENVKGLLSPTNKYHYEETVSKLESSDYKVTSKSYLVSDFGIAQSRTRVLITAVLDEKPLNLNLKHKSPKRLSDILRGSEDIINGQIYPLSEEGNDYKISRRISQGQKLSNVRCGISSIHTWNIPEVFGQVNDTEISILEIISRLRRQNRRRSNGDADPVEPYYIDKSYGSDTSEILNSLIKKGYAKRVEDYIDITHTFNGKYRRPHWNDVSPTVDTRFGQPRYFLHPDQHRGFTVREAARIQSFPDSYKFFGSDQVNFRMIGNAVPPSFSIQIAEYIRDEWFKR
ncbi:DNA cytosine methyltransferase [Loktanella sp. M215]|uniref:DNA cytosine methyltransferase n=1 Tax=Loktanella sp. M215 TaxID=2675431 RepID=UPI001F25B151